ncbi:MAG: NAD-dependent deacetylase [Geminicoccaceae bacterium]|nr:NAD-dependent deacetylase [Geminicoccaceae bacterium]
MERDASRVADDAIATARDLLREASRVVVLTGAGISAESGVPTFRGGDGLWKTHRAEDLATPEAFARDPRLVWEWYGWRREVVAACAPNAAHHALAAAARERPGLRIITQNVDGLHAMAAGNDGARPLELHGSLFRTQCTRCAASWDDRQPVDATSGTTLPRCAECRALARPGVVWFGESLDPRVLGDAVRRASAADACLVVGTSAVVYPAAGLADLTRRAGGSVIEVNVTPTPLTSIAAVAIRGTAVSVIPSLFATDSTPAPPSR